MTANNRFSDLKSSVLDALDIVEEYRKMGLEIVENVSPSNGWIPCHSYGKKDTNPSAQICVNGSSIGQYIDFSGGIGEGRAISIFDFSAQIGNASDWLDAMKRFAIQLGLEIPELKDPGKAFHRRSFLEPMARTWTNKKGTTPEAFQRAGGFMADYPAKRSNSEICMMLPVFDQYGTGGHPCGYVAWKRSGKPFQMGESECKMQTLKNSESGLMGQEALENLQNAEIVWKVEGPTDMLALMEAIPEPLRKKHVVLTNSAGCREIPKPWVLELLAGKTVYVLGDADKPGQLGAARWAQALSEHATVRNIQLPYTIESNHGKDVRDFFAEGHAYDELEAIAANTQETLPESKSEDPLQLYRMLLDSIGIEPIGEYPDQTVTIFSRNGKKLVKIRDLDKLSYSKLLQISGKTALESVVEETSESGQASMRQVRIALALCCRENLITDENTKGQGIWVTPSGKILLVGKGEALVWDGVKAQTLTSPRCENFLIDFSSGETFWPADMAQRLETFDPEKGRATIDRLGTILAQWKWETQPGQRDPVFILVGLIVATFIQTGFRFRPMISITGESESGKTTLIQTITSLFKRLGEKLSNVTEAALRQYVSNSAKPLFLDEFEYTESRQRILEILRTSSDGSKIIRGTQEQKVKAFGLRHIVWMLAIEINLQRAPDANRFLEFSLKRPQAEESGKLKIPSASEMEEMGIQLMTIAIVYAKDIFRIAEHLSQERFPGRNTREIQNFAVPAAVLASVFGDAPKRILEYFLLLLPHKEVESDQDDLFQTLMIQKIRFSFYPGDSVTEYTVGFLIDYYFSNDTYTKKDEVRDALLNCGIIVGNAKTVRDDRQCEGVFFAKKGIAALLKGTEWRDQSAMQILRRMEGVKESKRKCGAFGQTRGVEIPLSFFVECEDEPPKPPKQHEYAKLQKPDEEQFQLSFFKN